MARAVSDAVALDRRARPGHSNKRSAPSGTAPVKSAGRTLDILEELAAHGPNSLHVLAARLHLPKSSLHALLRTLVRRGWLETDATGTIYSLGIHSLLVGAAYLDADIVVGSTGPLLDELAQATGETVHLARLEGRDVVYLAKRESVHPLRMFSATGRRLPAWATALGRAMLAELSDDEVVAVLPPSLEPVTPHTVTEPSQLLAILDAVRRDGYAVEQQESCLGMGCFAVSIPFSAPARDAISVAVPLSRLDDDLRARIVEELMTTRRRLAEHPFASNGPPAV